MIFLFALPSVFSTYGVLCTSNSPAEIMAPVSDFDSSGTFSIILRNITEGEIDVVSIYSRGVLVIEDSSDGLIGRGGDILISGTLSPDVYPIREQILLTYVDRNDNKKEATIACSGAPSDIGGLEQALVLISFLALALAFFVAGVIALFYGHKKRKGKIKFLGLLLLVAFAILFLFFILLLLSNP